MDLEQPTSVNTDYSVINALENSVGAISHPPEEMQMGNTLVLNAENPSEKLKEITDKLEQGIKDLFESEKYKTYLKTMSKFHNYSFKNTMLIAIQKPESTLIAGFNSWKNNFGRQVRKGEKGIKIIAPAPFKVKKEMERINPQTQRAVIGNDGRSVVDEVEITIPSYKVVSVFDVSQTEGKELPEIGADKLDGDVDKYKDFFAALEKTSTVPIGFENIETGTNGYYHLKDKRIALQEGMSELQTLTTAIHEISHARLHYIDVNAANDEKPRKDNRTCEVEAESIAYTVCQHYGLDTSDYSFAYIAGWSKNKELAELKASLETIRATADELITEIDRHFADIQRGRGQDQVKEARENRVNELSNAAADNINTKPNDVMGCYKIEAAKAINGNGWTGLETDVSIAQALIIQGHERNRIHQAINRLSPETAGKSPLEMTKYSQGITEKALTPEIRRKIQEVAKNNSLER